MPPTGSLPVAADVSLPAHAAPGHGRQVLIPQCQHRVGNEPFMLVMLPIDSPQPPLYRRDHAW